MYYQGHHHKYINMNISMNQIYETIKYKLKNVLNIYVIITSYINLYHKIHLVTVTFRMNNIG